MTRTPRAFATLSDQLNICALLNKHGTQLNGFYVYADGWNDERVAAEVGKATGSTHLNAGHVARIRADTLHGLDAPASKVNTPKYGRIRPSPDQAIDFRRTTLDRLESLEAAVMRLSRANVRILDHLGVDGTVQRAFLEGKTSTGGHSDD